jgi:nitrite reductase/ring-hydroxylating ferredoxin subunit
VKGVRRLCKLSALPDGRAALVATGRGPARESLLLVRRGNRVAGFVNRCPHMGLPLDLKPDRLALRGGDFLRCSHHGALFRVDDGLCVAGPCEGEHLDATPLRIVDGVVMLAAEPSCRA